MQVSKRLERLEEIADTPATATGDPDGCSCDKVSYYPHRLYIECVNPHPAHSKPCYRDWLSGRFLTEQRTVVKGKCLECKGDLGYLWDMTNTPEAEREIVMKTDPHGTDDIHYRHRLIRDGFLDFVDWPTQEEPNAEFKYAN